MTVVLPQPGASPVLDRTQWAAIQKTLTNVQPSKGSVDLPPFSITTDGTLTPALKKMGVEKAYQLGTADFSGISPAGGMYLSDVKQKATIEVNENGTKAGAATTASIIAKGLSDNDFDMRVNRPFFYAITDDRTGAILFMGTVTDPTKK